MGFFKPLRRSQYPPWYLSKASHEVEAEGIAKVMIARHFAVFKHTYTYDNDRDQFTW